MNYSSYKEAFSALVQDNDGVLPDLYESVDITIFCHPVSAPAITTVADVVAYALIEASDEISAEAACSRPPNTSPVTAVLANQFVCLDSLLSQAIACHN